jgi:hypothetical protein
MATKNPDVYHHRHNHHHCEYVGGGELTHRLLLGVLPQKPVVIEPGQTGTAPTPLSALSSISFLKHMRASPVISPAATRQSATCIVCTRLAPPAHAAALVATPQRFRAMLVSCRAPALLAAVSLVLWANVRSKLAIPESVREQRVAVCTNICSPGCYLLSKKVDFVIV